MTAIPFILGYILALFAPIFIILTIYLYNEYKKTYGDLE